MYIYISNHKQDIEHVTYLKYTYNSYNIICLIHIQYIYIHNICNTYIINVIHNDLNVYKYNDTMISLYNMTQKHD